MMTHFERILEQYIPEDKIAMASIEIMAAMTKDLREPVQLLGLEGEERLIEIVDPALSKKRNL
jgi:hypothetical protein